MARRTPRSSAPPESAGAPAILWAPWRSAYVTRKPRKGERCIFCFGRLAARELLLNTPAVASLIADGRTTQLPMAIEEGRKIGMMSLNESLAGLVKSSAVDVREAYRRAGDRPGLLALLKRHGVDITPLERHA